MLPSAPATAGRRKQSHATAPLGARVPEQVHCDRDQPHARHVGQRSATVQPHEGLLCEVGRELRLAGETIQVAEEARELLAEQRRERALEVAHGGRGRSHVRGGAVRLIGKGSIAPPRRHRRGAGPDSRKREPADP